MTDRSRPFDTLSVEDFQAFPVWRFTNNDEVHGDETFVRPLKRLPVTNLGGKIVGVQVTLANGRSVWAVIGNVDPANPRLTSHMLSVSLERDGRWFHLARYFDFDFEQRSPHKAAEFLGLSVDEAFPITYDIQKLVKGDAAALAGQIPREPIERLPLEELMALSFPDPGAD
jgi:hypothetical protein